MLSVDECISYLEDERMFTDSFLSAEYQLQQKAFNMAKNQILNLKFNSLVDEAREERINKAIYEQAFYLFENSQRINMINSGIANFSVEGLSESYDKSKLKYICEEAKQFLNPYMLKVVSIC